MTLDEMIKNMETIAEANQRVIDTGIVFNDVPTDMLYCDNTEEKEKRLANYQRRAEEHRQLAEWLKDYKRLLEQEPCEDTISRQAVKEQMIKYGFHAPDMTVTEFVEGLPPANSQQKDRTLDNQRWQMMKNAVVIKRNLCDSCVTKGCIFQSGIVRSHCDFYKAESEEQA